MARWLVETDVEIQEMRNEVEKLEKQQQKYQEMQDRRRSVWSFRALYEGQLLRNEYLAITGNCEKLGFWQPEDVLIMKRMKGKKNTFTAEIKAPSDDEIFYRYVIVAWNPLNEHIKLRQWETHMKPRSVYDRKESLENFGWLNGTYMVDNSWILPGDNNLQFKIFNAPFVWPENESKLPLMVKVRSMCATHVTKEKCDETTIDIESTAKNKFSPIKVSNLSDSKYHKVDQTEYGVLCGANDLIIFDLAIKDLRLTLYRFDIYTFGRCDPTSVETPCFFGYGYVEPDQLRKGQGRLKIRINASGTRKTRCFLKVDYLVIRAYTGYNFTLEHTFAHYWNEKKFSTKIGHRGCGKTYQLNGKVIRENTIFSFNRAADNGADMVEFDVVLTKDGVPVVFHDNVITLYYNQKEPFTKLQKLYDILMFPSNRWTLCELMERAGRIDTTKMILSIENFTLDELKSLKAYHFYSHNKFSETSCKQLIYEQMPFKTLNEIMTEVNPKLGFNIEVKWPQREGSKRWENDGFAPLYDHNVYIDKILDIIFRTAGQRKIIFSSLEADTCLMLRRKQNVYPTILVGASSKKQFKYNDNRVNNFHNMACTAKAYNLMGCAISDNTILEQPQVINLMKCLHLKIFVWCSDANDHRTSHLIWNSKQIQGIIFDHMDKSEGIENKSQMFLLEKDGGNKAC